MATEVQNKFVHNGTEYEFAVDTTPVEDSVKFITSGAVAGWVTSLTAFAGKSVVDDIIEYSTNVPTSGAVYRVCAKVDLRTGRLSAPLRHTVLKGIYNTVGEAQAECKESKTTFAAGYVRYYSYDSSEDEWTENATEVPQKGILYFDELHNHFYKWNGSAMVLLM